MVNNNIKKYISHSDSSSDEEDLTKKKKYISHSDSSSDEEDLTKKKKITSSDEKNSDSSNNRKKKLTKKDSKFSAKQREIFEKIKELLKLNEDNNIFTSFHADKIRNKIVINMIDDIKKYFGSNIWSLRTEKKSFYHMSIIRKIFKFYGFKIAYNNTTRLIDGKKIQGRKFTISEI